MLNFLTNKIYLQRGRERDRELKTSISCLLHTPTGDVPTTKVHALDQNRTWDPSVHRPVLYPLSQTGFGNMFVFKKTILVAVQKMSSVLESGRQDNGLPILF